MNWHSLHYIARHIEPRLVARPILDASRAANGNSKEHHEKLAPAEIACQFKLPFVSFSSLRPDLDARAAAFLSNSKGS